MWGLSPFRASATISDIMFLCSFFREVQPVKFLLDSKENSRQNSHISKVIFIYLAFLLWILCARILQVDLIKVIVRLPVNYDDGSPSVLLITCFDKIKNCRKGWTLLGPVWTMEDPDLAIQSGGDQHSGPIGNAWRRWVCKNLKFEFPVVDKSYQNGTKSTLKFLVI